MASDESVHRHAGKPHFLTLANHKVRFVDTGVDTTAEVASKRTLSGSCSA
ncbi:MAG: hypothetical protein ACI8TF_002896 [Paracoccaceae bacterium]|jgi:hypothetical protein